VQVVKKEEIETGFGTFKTILIRPVLQSEGIFSRKGDILIWLTDDAKRLPVFSRQSEGWIDKGHSHRWEVLRSPQSDKKIAKIWPGFILIKSFRRKPDRRRRYRRHGGRDKELASAG